MSDHVFVSFPSQLVAFVLASILFIQVPGPSLLFTIGRALTVGRRDALLSAFGACTGDPAFSAAADFDANGCIDLADLTFLLSNFGA